MKPPAFSVPVALLTLPLLVACGDNARSETEAAAGETTSAVAAQQAASLTAAVPGAGQSTSAPRLGALPRQIRDYHQTTYVDECRAYQNSTLTVREPGYVTMADFNGDGRPDYVLSGTHLECSAGASYICGNGTCPFDMFLSRGDGFTMVHAVGHEGELTRQGGRPAFMVTTKSGQVNRLGPASDPAGAAPLAPLGIVAGYYVDEGTSCSDPIEAFYYDGKRAGVIFKEEGIAPDPIGRVTKEGGEYFLPNAEILVKVLGPARVQLTIQDTEGPKRLCPASQIPQSIRRLVR